MLFIDDGIKAMREGIQKYFINNKKIKQLWTLRHSDELVPNNFPLNIHKTEFLIVEINRLLKHLFVVRLSDIQILITRKQSEQLWGFSYNFRTNVNWYSFKGIAQAELLEGILESSCNIIPLNIWFQLSADV